ncbi:phage baseplate assembly protein V [Frankia sp. CiP1_Cm_nod2]|uniref:phage baseplate assembly protein V n=1 Tax=Frankia sp. CiP1_Cm_nod2 TaxID=2897161 RepID=UPI002025309B
MSMIVNTLQEIIRHELRGIRVNEVGLVEAVHPHADTADGDNYGCDVRLRGGLLLRRVPIATTRIGSAAVPNVGDLVLLAFDRGDVNAPIVVGRLYNDVDRPPLNKPNEVIFRLPLAGADDRTVRGAVRTTDRGTPARELIFELPPKITVRVTDAAVRATAGRTELRLDQPDGGSGTVTVVAGRTRIVMNQDGDVTVEAAQAMTLRATGSLTLEGASVAIKGTGDVTVEAGGSATLKASGTATVQAAGATTLQGALVAIKGVTSFSP